MHRDMLQIKGRGITPNPRHHTAIIPDRLFPDLLHQAIMRIVDSEEGRRPWAPSVRIVNLSIGFPARALTRRMSPAGRLVIDDEIALMKRRGI